MSIKTTLLLSAVVVVAATLASPVKSFADWDHGNPHNNGWHDNRAYQDHYYHGNPHYYNRGTTISFGFPLYEEPAPVYVQQYQPVYYPEPVVYTVPAYYGQPVYAPVPRPILMRLQPAPYGYYYGMRNPNQVVVISQRTHRAEGFISLNFR